MKTILTILAMTTISLSSFAQRPAPGRHGGESQRGQRKYEIIVTNAEASNIEDTNRRLDQSRTRSLNRARGLDTDLLNALSSTGVGQIVSASTSVLGIGVNYLKKAIKGSREDWYNTAQRQCSFHRLLSTESHIDDFYSRPSVQGAMDPANLKFEGFGCRSYIELPDKPGWGNEALYMFCSMRRDDEGLSHITDHSKFKMQIDTLMFNPRFCNLPNDSTGQLDATFDFRGRKDLVLNIKARIYSSWINEAIMVTRDQLLGEFSITARIDSTKLENGLFIYSANDPEMRKLVSIDGDCFIVPRSFTGTTDAVNYSPAWGTGQYRIEMEITESCRIDDAYYQFPSKPGEKPKWDKSKWGPEWKAMKAARRAEPDFLSQAWRTVTAGYVGDGWVAIITEPITKTLITHETTQLNNIFSVVTTSPAAGAAGRTQTGAGAGAPGMSGTGGQAGAAGVPGGQKPNK